MGVAKEGCMQHIPSMAFSSCNYDVNADLVTFARRSGKQVVKRVLGEGLAQVYLSECQLSRHSLRSRASRLAEWTWGSWINEVVTSYALLMGMNTIGWWAIIAMTSPMLRILISGR